MGPALTGLTVAMLIATVYASRLIRRWAFFGRIILVKRVTLPFARARGSIAHDPVGILPVQILDGLSSGLRSVAISAFVVHLLHGSGRVNPGHGAVKAAEAAGACLSPMLGGWIANRFEFPAAFTGTSRVRRIAQRCAPRAVGGGRADGLLLDRVSCSMLVSEGPEMGSGVPTVEPRARVRRRHRSGIRNAFRRAPGRLKQES
ncbi:hypothetical protein SB861_39500 [Paraburkholderia sp. SIMBA_049]